MKNPPRLNFETLMEPDRSVKRSRPLYRKAQTAGAFRGSRDPLGCGAFYSLARSRLITSSEVITPVNLL